jgi:hypothetical protein
MPEIICFGVRTCSMVQGSWRLSDMDRKCRCWGVTCDCGEFQALKEIVSLGDEKRPDVDLFKFICTHSESGALYIKKVDEEFFG